MKKELELNLVRKYPKILCEYGGDKKETCMHWGIECGDGWYEILDSLLGKLNALEKYTDINVVSEQIKEKFGVLRFYYKIEDKTTNEYREYIHEIIRDIVTSAENLSSRICEITGEDGVLCSRVGWLKTLCKEEADKEGYAPINSSIAKYWDNMDNETLENETDVKQ